MFLDSYRTLWFSYILDLEGGKFFFNTVREGDSVLFATEDENDANNWVMAFYRATGQAHKPSPPVAAGPSSTNSKAQGGTCVLYVIPYNLNGWWYLYSPAEADRARKHGMEEFIAGDPITFDHHNLFSTLQKLSMEWRLKDPYASLVRARSCIKHNNYLCF